MSSSRLTERFQDIITHIDDVRGYTEGLSKDDLQSDRKTRQAVERCISVISEAAVKLGDMGSKYAPDIPWHDIRGIGNAIRHDYDDVNIDTIWEIIIDDLPPLHDACLTALAKLDEEASDTE
jgi:uncharacterized protein with HEPN domain